MAETNSDYLRKQFNKLKENGGFRDMRRKYEKKGLLTNKYYNLNSKIHNKLRDGYSNEEGIGEEGLSKAEEKEFYDLNILKTLEWINKDMISPKNDFKFATGQLEKLKFYTQDPKFNEIYSEKEKEKFLGGISKRIERGIKNIKKDPSEEKVANMEKILEDYESIENKLLPKEKTGLEKTIIATSICSILGGVILISPNLTGNAIGTISKDSGSIFGGILFILGIGGLFLLKKR